MFLLFEFTSSIQDNPPISENPFGDIKIGVRQKIEKFFGLSKVIFACWLRT